MLKTAFLFFLLLAPIAHAQETASGLAQRVQSMLIKNSGVAMSFSLPNEGKVTATVDFSGKHLLIESASTKIISNGTTVWNVSKTNKRVTIDNVAKTNSPYTDPASLFKFADNYSAAITKHSGTHYTLELTPNASLASLMKAAGDAQKLVLEVTATKKQVKIVSASVQSSRGSAATGKLKITPLKHLRPAEFQYSPQPGYKMLDLRE